MSGFTPSTFDLSDTSLLQEALSHSKTTSSEPYTEITLHSLSESLNSSFLKTLQSITSDPTHDYLFPDGNGPLLPRYTPTKTTTGRYTALTCKIYSTSSPHIEYISLKHLLHLTSLFPSLSATIRDSIDSEFILIESAEVIPDWLSPENSENRVWIKSGSIYLLENEKDDDGLELDKALVILVQNHLKPNIKINSLINKRIKQAISEPNLHRTPVILPLNLAEAVKSQTGLGLKCLEKYVNLRIDDRIKNIDFGGEYVITCLDVTRIEYSKLVYTIDASPDVVFEEGFEDEKVSELDSFCKSEGYLKSALEVGKRITIGAYALEGWDRTEEGDVKEFDIPKRGEVDGDEWLSYDGMKEFEEKMREVSESLPSFETKKEKERKGEKDLDDIAKHMSRFVNSESDFEGVEVGGKEGVNIDADKFMRILENAMGEVDEDGGGDLEGYFSDEDEGDSDDEEEESIKTVMKQMDDQVPRGEGENVDVDVDVVRNLIESVLGEEGEGGPASNLMKSLGVDFEEFRGT